MAGEGETAIPTNCNPGRLPPLLGHRDRDGEDAHRCLSQGSGALLNTAPSLSPEPPAHMLVKAG